MPPDLAPFDPSLAARLPPPPRRVSRRPGGSALALWFPRLFTLPHVLVGLGSLGFLAFTIASIVAATPGNGRVTEKRTGTARKSQRTTYTLCYAYDAGERRTSCDGVSAETFARYAVGDAVPLQQFDAYGLHASRLEGGNAWAFVGFLVVWCLVWNGAMGFLVYFLWILPIRERRLCVAGEAARGTVVSKKVVRGKGIRRTVRYRFTTPEGATFERETSALPAAFDAAEENGPVTVLYDPENPARSIAYELSNFVIDDA